VEHWQLLHCCYLPYPAHSCLISSSAWTLDYIVTYGETVTFIPT
jgi:hypothetical protein